MRKRVPPWSSTTPSDLSDRGTLGKPVAFLVLAHIDEDKALGGTVAVHVYVEVQWWQLQTAVGYEFVHRAEFLGHCDPRLRLAGRRFLSLWLGCRR
jgi:hypothetical protein